MSLAPLSQMMRRAPPPVGGAFDWGFNFRQNEGSQTDPAGMSWVRCEYFTIGDNTPWLYGSSGSAEIRSRVGDPACNAGWTNYSEQMDDRDMANADPRLGGAAYLGNTAGSVADPAVFRVDVQNGVSVNIGMGLAYNARLTPTIELWDGLPDTGSLIVPMYDPGSYDPPAALAADGVVYPTVAAWASAQDDQTAEIQHTFVNGMISVRWPLNASLNTSAFSHLRLRG